jgi:hypothetical protein
MPSNFSKPYSFYKGMLNKTKKLFAKCTIITLNLTSINLNKDNINLT